MICMHKQNSCFIRFLTFISIPTIGNFDEKNIDSLYCENILVDRFQCILKNFNQTWALALTLDQLTKTVTPWNSKDCVNAFTKKFNAKILRTRMVIFPLDKPNGFKFKLWFILRNCQFWFFGTWSAGFESELKPWSYLNAFWYSCLEDFLTKLVFPSK